MSIVAQKIEELTQRFIRSLPERVASITETWTRTRENGASSASRRELMSRLHALAGTAATYGVTDIADLAREAESLFAAPFDPVAIDTLDTIIETISRMVARS